MSTRPLSPQLLNRREAMLRLSAAMGTALVGASALVSGCATMDARAPRELFSRADVALLDEIAETILPATDTPGAKAARVGEFMTVMVADTYRADEQAAFLAGLETLEAECLGDYGLGFLAATRAQRTALLERLDREQFDAMRARRAGEPVHYFRMLKELSLHGYFTSEIGYIQAMRYVESPGRFDPCVPYAPGDRAWADHA
jgi:hypothetical protein